MSAPSAIITVCTTWPLMSRPRISPALRLGLVRRLRDLDAARLAAATGLHLGLDDDHRGAQLGSAAARASAGVVAVMPRSTGTPCVSKMSRAWYSYRSTPASRLARGVASGPQPAGTTHAVRSRLDVPVTLVVRAPTAESRPLRRRSRRRYAVRPASRWTFASTQETMSAMVAPGVNTWATPSAASVRPISLGDDAAAEHDDVGGLGARPAAPPPGGTRSCALRTAPTDRSHRRPRPGRCATICSGVWCSPV